MLDALIFLVQTLADLFLLAFLLRFIMQWVRANHYNPLSQVVFKVTNPLVVPARRVLPSVAGLDAPTFVVLFVLEVVVTFVLLRLAALSQSAIGVFAASSLNVVDVLFYSVLRLISLTLLLYIGATFIYVLLSWFGDRGRNPMAALLGDVVEPVLRPVRRVLPPVSGLDIAPLIVTVVLYAIRMALPLPYFLR
jgi:YggT family protein